MKRILLLIVLSCFGAVGYAQGTYYWVGGASGSWSSASNWNTTLGGGGTSRAVVNTADILIFDGSNIGAGATGAVTVQPTGNEILEKLILQNAATLNLGRTTAGTTYLYIDGEVAVASNSVLNVNGTIGTMSVVLNATSNSTIQGQLNVIGAGTNRLSVKAADALKFAAGSSCSVGSATNPFSTLTTSTNPSVDKSVVFQSGSSLVYQSQFNPFGGNSASNIVVFQSGSNLIVETANVSNLFNGKTLGNVIVRNNATVNLSAVGSSGESFSTIENLTILPGAAFYIRHQSSATILGNIVNNGTFGTSNSPNAITSSQLLMAGTTPQTISGSGVFADLGGFSIGTNADVTLDANLNLVGTSQSSLAGILNMNDKVISGTSNLQARERYSITNNTASITMGSPVVTLGSAADYSAIKVGLGVLVTGPNIPANSFIVSTNTASQQFTLSNAATATASGTSITLTTNTHLITSHPLGIDGNIALSGSKSYADNVNYTFNAATVSPFTTNSSSVGDVTFNAAATTNKSVSIGGVLTLNNAKLTVNEGDNLTLEPTATLNGTFNNAAYIVTAANAATGAVGTLKLNGLSANTLIPVGTPANFLPVTLSPATASDVEINVFTGATADATPNGTALTAAQKLRMVDAVWNINRTSGTGNVDLTLGWDNTLEGADFSGFTSAQIGIAGYAAGNYGMFTGTGDAGANTVALNTSTFLPFIVGEANTTLPLTLISFTAKESLNSVKLAWQTTDEVNLKNYVLQHRRGDDFQDIYTVAANNKPGVFNYNYTHLNPTAGTNYYRLVGVDFDGSKQTSNPIPVTVTLGNEVTVYPNPVTQKNISVSGVIKGDVIRILNIQGQVVFTKTASGNQVEEINVQNIQAGTYILSIENSGRITSTKKLIKI
ncbi:beta strand repeat-containing protein [Pedobacter helvus]|uniref:Beta strand repeat-containing protein n=1 Tax=Pedobacter helvus TaxID=2563444 RepID=A0ABW9JEU6_9SPHI|nr:T9SS type A sorting domain-containing protein [Pedobacter ureilyticus]